MEVDIAMSGVDTKVLMTFYVEDNTSRGKDLIFDFSNMVHVCSYKEMFSLVAKKVTVDGSAISSKKLKACKIFI